MRWPWRRRSRDLDLDEEIAFDLAAEAEDNRLAGMPPDEAERRSRREFGNILLAKEETRAMWGWGWYERLAQDLKYGLRMMGRNPSFTAIAVVSLALGIGANTAIYSFMDALSVARAAGARSAVAGDGSMAHQRLPVCGTRIFGRRL